MDCSALTQNMLILMDGGLICVLNKNFKGGICNVRSILTINIKELRMS